MRLMFMCADYRKAKTIHVWKRPYSRKHFQACEKSPRDLFYCYAYWLMIMEASTLNLSNESTNKVAAA
jgi:hypothetical protein